MLVSIAVISSVVSLISAGSEICCRNGYFLAANDAEGG